MCWLRSVGVWTLVLIPEIQEKRANKSIVQTPKLLRSAKDFRPWTLCLQRTPKLFNGLEHPKLQLFKKDYSPLLRTMRFVSFVKFVVKKGDFTASAASRRRLRVRRPHRTRRKGASQTGGA